MTIDEFNGKLRPFHARCINKKHYFSVQVSPTKFWGNMNNRLPIAEIPYNSIGMHIDPDSATLLNIPIINIFRCCYKFAFTYPADRISERNQDRISDLLHIRSLLNKHPFPKDRAEHYITKQINRLKVHD